jgi:Cyclin, N-terminal domain
MAAAIASVVPQHPAGFLLNSHHPQPVYPDPAPSAQTTAPVAPKPQPTDPYYGHEETARLSARFIRHVFNCPSDVAPTTRKSFHRIRKVILIKHIEVAPNTKPTETTISLPRFIAYAFHRTRLPTSVAYHALFLLARLKARYPAASCAYGHRLFLTSYMLSSKVICDDTYSNKVCIDFISNFIFSAHICILQSWAIVGQGFYELRDVNLMEREMIHYLSFDLTITAAELEKFTLNVKANYRRGVPKSVYVVVQDKTRENDHFGKGTLEIDTRPLTTVSTSAKRPISIETASNSIVPSHAPIPIQTTITPISPDEEDSPYADSSSSNSSRTSSPPSPYPKTPPYDAVIIGASNRHGAKHNFRGSMQDIRDVVHLGSESNYASPSGW